MAKIPTYRNAVLTLDTAAGSHRYEVLEPVRMGSSTSGVGTYLSFPSVVPIPTPSYFDGEVKTITDEEKTQRNLIEAAEKITREFRSAERELLDQHYAMEKLEAQHNARKLERVGDLRRVINDVLDRGVEWDALRELLADEHREHADDILEAIYALTQLDNLLVTV